MTEDQLINIRLAALREALQRSLPQRPLKEVLDEAKEIFNFIKPSE